jgi:hypothetical protein
VAAIKMLSILATRMAAAFALTLSTAAPTGAADWFPVKAPPAMNGWSFTVLSTPTTYVGEFGTRLWYGQARTRKDLFDDTGGLLVSRLDYKSMDIFTGEAFTRFDFNTGWFAKAYLGGGGLFGGEMIDEDFPPVTSPYSATVSDQRRAYIAYASGDLGIKLIRGPDFHVGAFVGYHFMRDHGVAFGCRQIATNPMICGGGGVPGEVRVISQNNDWHSLRVGLEGAVEYDRWKLAIDAAWLPYARLDGWDAHWLRIGTVPGAFTGKIPEDGDGWGFQLDGFLSYRVTDQLSVGLGGRWWKIKSEGHTHFENRVVGVNAVPQVVKWKAEHFGVFLQSSFKFGPYPLAANFDRAW